MSRSRKILLMIDGCCAGCQRFVVVYLVAPWRYRCTDCSRVASQIQAGLWEDTSDVETRDDEEKISEK